MSVWLAIWNGPFHIGKLSRPVSVGDVMMKVLETVWRAAVIAVGLASTGIALLALHLWRTEQRNEAAERALVIDAQANFTECSSDAPILVSIRNGGSGTVGYVSYGVEIIDPSSGANVAPTHLDYLSTTRDIPPNSTLTSCQTPYVSYGSETGFSFRPQHRVRAVVHFASAR